jgi:hypothetical protein
MNAFLSHSPAADYNPASMESDRIQELCAFGQEQLSRMEYLGAEKTLATAEELAWGAKDWDSLARLYMPLQESRRQRRQRCGEGKIRLDFIASGPTERINGKDIVETIQQGQILVAGWGSIQPATEARRAQKELELYVDVFLAAAYPTDQGRTVVIVPGDDAMLPATPNRIEISDAELGAVKTYEAVMAIWELLHAPFLAAADATVDPVSRMEAYRKTIGVDYACELAHQRLADTARGMCVRT